MLKAHVVFATITGNNELVADAVTDQLTNLGVKTIETDMDQTDPIEFKDADICVVCSYTYENGDKHLPIESIDFFSELKKLDLSKQIYGVAGSGDTFYKRFYNVAVDIFDQAFKRTKAVQGAKCLKINLEPDAKDIKIRRLIYDSTSFAEFISASTL
ncbi:MAG: flavodoxin [Acetilactobacillus jinshanensis]